MIILNESKIKYEKLNELLEAQLQDIRFSQQVNIIVDLKEIIKKFFRPDIFPEIKNKKLLIEEISSDIINIIGHYRNYFFKKNKYTTFYFLYSFERCNEFINLMPNYKEEYYAKYFNKEDPKVDVIKRSIQAVEKIISIIPSSVFINTSDYDELVYARALLDNIPTNEMTLILSNDTVFYQLLSKNIFLLNLKGIKSSLVTKENAVSVLVGRETIISSNLIPLVLSLSGNKKYSFKGINHVALTRSIQIIENLIKRKIVVDDNSVAIPLDFSKLDTSRVDAMLSDNKDSITSNYSLIRGDTIYFKNKILIQTHIANSYKTKKTFNYFLELNAKVFTTYPLQLDMLVKGEKI